MQWFKKIKHIYAALTREFAGKPIQYVEIGVWGGDSARWCCEHVLTHPEARGYGIDPYEPDCKRTQADVDLVMDGANRLLANYAAAGKWKLIRQRSQDALRVWEHGPIDFLYIDGSHAAHDVLADFVLAWPLLKQGSLVLFDDYGIGLRQAEKDGFPRVPVAVAAITQCFAPFIEAVPVDGIKQFALRVVTAPPSGEFLFAGFKGHKLRLKPEFQKPAPTNPPPPVAS